MTAKKRSATPKRGRAAPKGKRTSRRRDPDVLTPKEERFVAEYLIDSNGAAAAIRAGYSAKSANFIAHQMLRGRPRIIKAVEAGRARLAQKTELSAERVVNELAAIAFANAGDYFAWGPDGITVRDQMELTREQMAVVAEVSETKTMTGGTVKVKLHDKLGALMKLGQHLGVFVDKVEVTGKDGGPLEYADVSDDEIDKRLAALGVATGHGKG